MELLYLLEIMEKILLSVADCPKCEGCKLSAQNYFVMRDAGDFGDRESPTPINGEKLG